MINRNNNLTTRKSIKKCSLLFGIIISLYIIESSPISLFHSSTYIYILKPIIWMAVIFIIWYLPRISSKTKLRYKSYFKECVIYIALINIAVLFLSGVIEGFGRSPYDLSISGMIRNLIILGTVIIGRELIRSYLTNSLSDRHSGLVMAVIAITMTIINLPLSRIIELKGGIETLQYVAERILPELSINILATYLVYIGGAQLSIIYIFIQQGFYWFCPILPNTKWVTKGLIGILVPAFSLMFIQYVYEKQTKELKKREMKKENPLGWILTSIFSVAIVWFAAGVFPVHPAVIATGSMKPMINPGDVVLVRKLKGSEVKFQDVIQFKKDNIYVFHRIIGNIEENKEMKYKTKGDNNSTADLDGVSFNDVKGKVVFVIPKIGWPTLLIKGKNDVPKEKVEF